MSEAGQGGLGWRFARRSASDVEHDPTEADQFNSEEVKLEQALIRESTQNSQDAGQSQEEPVKVRLSQVHEKDLDSQLLEELTAPLLPRLAASGIEVKLPQAKSVLIIEDFGTRGLTGAWDDDSDQGPFRSFWFRHGRSFKGGEKGGRWGLGKLVFPMSSALRCHFALTVRQDAVGGLLLGQAVLKTHTLEGVKYAPHGHWGKLEDDNVLPVTNAVFLKRFTDGFGLKRDGESGLSVVVPQPPQALDRETLTRYVVLNYAFPILTGRLVFDVMGEVIDEASVRDIGQELLRPGLIGFIDDVHAAAQSTLTPVPPPSLENQTYRIREDGFDPIMLHHLRERYAIGGHVGFRLPLKLKRTIDPAEAESFVDIHLKAAAVGETGDALCVRGDITVPGEARRFRSDTHFALLSARDPLASEFLGDAENPAHTTWSPEAERFKANWVSYPAHKLRLIRGSVGELHRLLATDQPQKDEKALLDFFWLDDPAEGLGGQGRPKTKKRGKITFRKPIDAPSSKRMLNITQVAGGFTVSPGPDFSDKVKPAQLRVEVAYDTSGTNAFAAWSPFDFDLSVASNIEVEVEGAKHLARGRRIDLQISGPQFRLNLSGFDPHRDLVVKTSWPTGAAPNA